MRPFHQRIRTISSPASLHQSRYLRPLVPRTSRRILPTRPLRSSLDTTFRGRPGHRTPRKAVD